MPLLTLCPETVTRYGGRLSQLMLGSRVTNFSETPWVWVATFALLSTHLCQSVSLKGSLDHL